MLKCVYKVVTMFSPQTLLSSASRERCMANLKQLPNLISDGNLKPNASVLVPICVHNGDVCLLYTLRSLKLSSHSGQVSFPGGRMDANETAYDTALRETEEEIGFPAKDVTVWSEMPLVQGRDKLVSIKPVIGVLNNLDMNKLQPSVNEVADIFTIPIKVLCDPDNHAHMVYNNIVIPVFTGGKHTVWGITGFITHFFLQCLLPPDTYDVNFLRKKYDIDELLPSKL